MSFSIEIHSPVTHAMLRYAQTRGIAREELIRLAEISDHFLDNSELNIDLTQLDAAWKHVSEALNDSLLGLHVGEFLDLSAFGIVGFLLQSSSELGKVIETVCRYTRLAEGVITLTHREVKNQWIINVGLRKDLSTINTLAFTQIMDAVLALIVKTLSELSHTDIAPTIACFPYRSQFDLDEYHRIFRSELKFEQVEHTLIYEGKARELPVIFSNSTLYELFERHVMSISEALMTKEDVTSQVKRVIIQHLSNDHLSLQVVAEDLFMSARTLQRKLKREGISFQELLDAVRKDMAHDYLVKFGFSVSNTALLLGLSESSSFIHAFKRWTGMSPKEYQIRNRK